MKEWMKIPLGIVFGLAIAAVILIVSSPPRGKPITLTTGTDSSIDHPG